MNLVPHRAAALAAAFFVCVPASAQQSANPQSEAAPASDAAAAPASPAVQEAAAPAATPAAAVPADKAACELHVWPTQTYLGINSGLLSGFGALGALADSAAHTNRVRTTKEYMADYLGPDHQLEELNKLGIAETLKLRGYRIVVEAPGPSEEEIKGDPAMKAKAKAINARFKAKQRLSDSKHPCYAELVTNYIFYHKAMMYGSNLFTFWTFRDFGDKQVAVQSFAGQVKNPLEIFPPHEPSQVQQAQVEIRDAFSKDFVEWAQKKLKP